MTQARKDATIQNLNKRVQKIRSNHEIVTIETTGYEDEMGYNVRDLMDSDNDK